MRKKAKLLAYISIFVLLTTSFCLSFSNTKAEKMEDEGSILSPIVEDTSIYANSFVEVVGDIIVSSIMNSFDPSFNTILKLEKGIGILPSQNSDLLDYIDYDDVKNSLTIGTLFNYAKYFGIILANLLFFFNLIICINGRVEQINDTPLSLLFKYVLALVLIQVSFNIILTIQNFCSGMWSDFVMEDRIDNVVSFSEDFYGNVMQENDAGEITIILGCVIDTPFIFLNALMPLLGIFLLWKIFKQFLRLFLEIAERYFVMMLLLVFMPAVIPTIISNNTKNIMSSYMRMFWCQLFILLCNAAFMKIFMYILLKGGWTAGLINYILCLAFMRVCQRIDTYMMAMGLNVAQTGGGVIGAGIGALDLFKKMLTGLSKDGIKQNMGKNTMADALRKNEYNDYVKGYDMSLNPLDKLKGRGKDIPSEDEFNKLRARKYGPMNDMGTMSTTNNTIDGFMNAASELHVPQKAISDLQNNGFNIEDIASIKQLDQDGTSFGFYDSDGQGIGFYEKGQTELYKSREDDLKAMTEDEKLLSGASPNEVQSFYDAAGGSYMHQLEPLADNNTIQTLTGSHSLEMDSYGKQQSFRTSYGKDTVVGIKNSLNKTNTNKYEVVSIAANPDVLIDKRYTRFKNSKGESMAFRRLEKVPKNPKTYEKNPANK